MCGIAGVFSTVPDFISDDVFAKVQKMANLMLRRGPDSEGCWRDESKQIGLGFRRLAILDISAAGNQPMVTPDGKFSVVFNGELYNFTEIKRELSSLGYTFKTKTDTEVVLYSLVEWGEKALLRFNGMFGLAFYNVFEKKLILARDHAGIKPLYYYLPPKGEGVVFSSQYNCLLLSPWKISPEIDEQALYYFLRLNYFPDPFGILKNTYQLKPGHFLAYTPQTGFQIHQYWSIPKYVDNFNFKKTEVTEFCDLFENVVKNQLVADVSTGVYLSGGIDSPIVTSAAKKEKGSQLQAFTIGVPHWEYDESKMAIQYNQVIQANHQVYSIENFDLEHLFDEVIAAQYEPFADFSMFPSLLVHRESRKKITVGLGGEGADELFYGYSRPFSLMRDGALFSKSHLERWMRYLWGRRGLGKPVSSAVISKTPGNYYFDVNSRFPLKTLFSIFPSLTTEKMPEQFVWDVNTSTGQLPFYSRYIEYYGQMQRCLKKVDMSSMHQSLEVRVPFLDRRIIDWVLNTDPSMHMENGVNKAFLRKVLAMYIPEKYHSKTKMGFSVPLGVWMRGPLRDKMEQVLKSAKDQTLIEVSHGDLELFWKSHLNLNKDYKWPLWTLASLFGWLNQNLYLLNE